MSTPVADTRAPGKLGGHSLPERCYPAAGLLGLAAFALYLFTLAPGLMPGDTGDMIQAAATLREAHPPGYPLYALLGKLFVALPVGTIPYRVNLMSAFLGGLSVALVFLCLVLLTRQALAALAGALLFAGNYLFWTYFVLAETFALNNFFLALTAFLALRWREQHHASLPGANRGPELLAFVCGLSLGNHHTMVLTFPGLLLFAAVVDRQVLRPRRLLRLLGLGALGLVLAYAYLPLAALFYHDHHWEDTGTLRGLVRLFLRMRYGTFQLAAAEDNPTTPGAQAARYFGALTSQYLLPGFLLGIAGLVVALRRDRAFTLYCGGGFLLGVLFILKANIDPSPTAFDAATLERFYQLPNFFFLLWVGYGLGVVQQGVAPGWSQPASAPTPPLWRKTAVLLLLLLPAWLLATNYHKASLRDNRLYDQFAADLLDSLPRGAVLLSWTDVVGIGMDYVMVGEQRRPDVALLLMGLLHTRPYRDTVARRYPHLHWPAPGKGGAFALERFLDENLKHRRVFVDMQPPVKLDLPLIRYGLLYEILPRHSRPTVREVLRLNEALWRDYDLRYVDTRRYPANAMCFSLVVFYYLFRRQAFATDCLSYGYYAEALHHLRACLAMDGHGYVATAAPWHRQMARAYLGLRQPAKALDHLEAARKAEPAAPDTYALLARAYQQQGNAARAAEYAARAKALAASTPPNEEP